MYKKSILKLDNQIKINQPEKNSMDIIMNDILKIKLLN